MDSLQKWQDACQRSADYPRTVITSRTREPTLVVLQQQLQKRAGDLFCSDTEAAVVFLELQRLDRRGYSTSSIVNYGALRRHMETSMAQHRTGPRRRFVFVQAPHSRAPLKVTLEMFQFMMTYFQVMPAFLEIVFPFGRQNYARDFHFCGFKAESRLNEDEKGLVMQELHWSGYHVELCYTLKSMESTSDAQRPWSIRQCSVYHKCDLITGQSTWFVVKANSTVQDLIRTHTSKVAASQPALLHGEGAGMTESLDIHALLATLSSENWQWYINDLESQFQGLTRSLMTHSSGPSTLTLTLAPLLEAGASQIQDEEPPPPVKKWSIRTLSQRSLSWPTRKRYSTQTCEEKPAVAQNPSESFTSEDFSFRLLPKVQTIQEKATEIKLVLTTNCSILDRLLAFYSSVFTRLQNNERPIDNVEPAFVQFQQEIGDIRDRLEAQRIRAEALLFLVNERKSLLNSVVQYQSMQASNTVASKAQESTEKMEIMTKDMHAIARKTEVETVSMRIITLVTLFFLPGTFIASVMSTPVVNFGPDDAGFSAQNVGQGALRLFVVISLPLVCLTFAAWYVVYWWEKRRGERRVKPDPFDAGEAA